jgi:hypothetical protein
VSPQQDNPFAGHLLPGDPRTVLFGCGGCTWPTVPAYRLFLGSRDACGTLAFLNNWGILFQSTQESPPYDAVQWDHSGIQWPIISAVVLKNQMENPYGYQLAVAAAMLVGVLEMDIIVTEQTCNRDHPMPETWIDGPLGVGCTGETCKLFQVEYDQDWPPGWGPP